MANHYSGRFTKVKYMPTALNPKLYITMTIIKPDISLNITHTLAVKS